MARWVPSIPRGTPGKDGTVTCGRGAFDAAGDIRVKCDAGVGEAVSHRDMKQLFPPGAGGELPPVHYHENPAAPRAGGPGGRKLSGGFRRAAANLFQ